MVITPGAGWGAKRWPAERYGEMARQLGAAATIDSRAPDLRAHLKAAAPRGTVDVIVDPVGGETFEAMRPELDAVRASGDDDPEGGVLNDGEPGEPAEQRDDDEANVLVG